MVSYYKKSKNINAFMECKEFSELGDDNIIDE